MRVMYDTTSMHIEKIGKRTKEVSHTETSENTLAGETLQSIQAQQVAVREEWELLYEERNQYTKEAFEAHKADLLAQMAVLDEAFRAKRSLH